MPPLSSQVPRGTPARSWGDAVGFFNERLTNYLEGVHKDRLAEASRKALSNVMPEVKKLLLDTGASGVLLQGRFERIAQAEGYTVDGRGPANMTERLVNGTYLITGPGKDPETTLALKFASPEIKTAFPSKGMEISKVESLWITIDAKKQFAVSRLNSDTLGRNARSMYLDQARFEQLKAEAYRRALEDTVRVVELRGRDANTRAEAVKLRVARDEALKSLEEIDSSLRTELDKARKANRDADVAAIVAALAGAAASYAENAQQPNVSTTVKVDQVNTASDGVLQIIKQRLSVEGKIKESDVQMGTFLQKDGKTVYVPWKE